MELKEAKRKLNYYKQMLIVSDETGTPNDFAEAIETVLQALEDLEIKNKARIIGKYGDVRLEDLLEDKFISKDVIEEKIREIDLKINNFKTEINKTLREIEEAGTETEIDTNEQYLERLEIELERLEITKRILEELLEDK